MDAEMAMETSIRLIATTKSEFFVVFGGIFLNMLGIYVLYWKVGKCGEDLEDFCSDFQRLPGMGNKETCQVGKNKKC